MKAKCVVSLGYRDYVVDSDQAITLLEILNKAEVFRETYDNKQTAYHVYPQDAEDGMKTALKLLPDDMYRIAKMAGKPLTKNA